MRKEEKGGAESERLEFVVHAMRMGMEVEEEPRVHLKHPMNTRNQEETSITKGEEGNHGRS